MGIAGEATVAPGVELARAVWDSMICSRHDGAHQLHTPIHHARADSLVLLLESYPSLIPFARLAVGAPVSFLKFTTANLLPVTLGNIVGGLALALAYGYAYGALGKDGAGAAATSK
jgi:hypothetical protein